MPAKTTLNLTDKEKKYLKGLIYRKNVKVQTVERAKMLLLKSEGLTYDEIGKRLNLHRNTVIKCIDKFEAGGIKCALKDLPRRSPGRGHGISKESREWIISLASREPRYAGYFDATWSYSQLTSYVRANAVKTGHDDLENVSAGTIRHILHDGDMDEMMLRRNEITRKRNESEVQLMLELDDLLPELMEEEPQEEIQYESVPEPDVQLKMEFGDAGDTDDDPDIDTGIDRQL